MHNEQRHRAHELLKKNGIRQALFAHPDSVTWLTGFAAPVQTGPSPFNGGPAYAWYDDGAFTLVVMSGQTASESENLSIRTYEGYTLDPGFAGSGNLERVLGELLSQQSTGRLGIETGSVPSRTADLPAMRTASFVPIDGWLAPLRMVKTEEELVSLRKAFTLTDTGHAAARASLRAGLREIDLWEAIRTAVEATAGRRVPLGNDCIVNTRQDNIGGWPGDAPILSGNSVIVDLGARVDGYWSDSCATYYADRVSKQAAAAHRATEKALSFGASLLRAGAVAGEIDFKMRGFIESTGFPVYPHHTGHGVGVAPHELPRIVPGNPQPLEPGMVVMLEPGIYIPGELAVRLEDAFLITTDSAVPLTSHDKAA